MPPELAKSRCHDSFSPTRRGSILHVELQGTLARNETIATLIFVVVVALAYYALSRRRTGVEAQLPVR